MPRSMLKTSLPLLAALATAAAPALLRAQGLGVEDDDKPAGEMPTFSGKGKVTEAINSDTGAIFDIGGGVTMLFPKGLPVGRSRLVTLQKARGRLPTQLIEKFKPVGPALDFSGAFNTARQPILLSVPAKSNPVRDGQKLVVAMEVGTFCEKQNKAFKLKGGLCTGFELQDADYDDASRRMVAKLRSTGGLRLQFGTVPANAGDE